MNKKLLVLLLSSIFSSINILDNSYAQDNTILSEAVQVKVQEDIKNEDRKVIKLEERTKEDIIQKSKQLIHEGFNSLNNIQVYEEEPNNKKPYKLGTLTDEFLKDGLNSINMVRYIAGLPDDIMMQDNLNNVAQHGAVLISSIGYLDHTPSKPDDMDQEFYEVGYKGTSSSNLGMGHNSLSDFNLSCMDDSDSRNIDRVGHRRWLLSPQLKYVGMGYANSYSATKVFDKSREEIIDYNYIAWPSKGVFPTEYFGGHQAWSVSLNPDKYQLPEYDKVSIELTRLNDNKKWILDSSINLQNGNYSNKEYFNIDTGNKMGINNCIIFRPERIVNYKNGDIFEVNISGIKDNLGQDTNIKYKVEFFDIDTPQNVPLNNYTNCYQIIGQDRYDTASQISNKGWDESNIESIVLVNGDSIADGITATPLADAYNAPILLSKKDSLPKETIDEIKRLKVKKIILVGGINSISKNVEDEIYKLTSTKPVRLSGISRYETSLEVAKYLDARLDTKKVYIAYGYGEPDALSIAAKAAEERQPVILVDKNDINNDIYKWLKSEDLQTAYFIGGENSISDSIISNINGLTIEDVSNNRVAGIDRVETNIKVIEKFYSNEYYQDIFVAKSDILVDALAVGPLAAKYKSPIIISSNQYLTDAQKEVLKDKKVTDVYQVGGVDKSFIYNLVRIFRGYIDQNYNYTYTGDEVYKKLKEVYWIEDRDILIKSDGSANFSVIKGIEGLDMRLILVGNNEYTAKEVFNLILSEAESNKLYNDIINKEEGVNIVYYGNRKIEYQTWIYDNMTHITFHAIQK